MFLKLIFFKMFIDIGKPMFNYCASSPCHNGGLCNNRNTGYKCNCTTGYHGDRCEHGKI